MASEEDLTRGETCIAVVAEAFLDRSLIELLDWLAAAAPSVRGLELGSGGYAPHPHLDRDQLLDDPRARSRWMAELSSRGFSVVALNAWGNPLHPDGDVGALHDRELRETIRLAAALEVDRVIALAGCPAGASGDRVPHFAASSWLPYLEGVDDEQWERSVAPYWSDLSAFARAEHPNLLICVELHPGSAVYNVATFARLAALGSNLAANIDPSHFFWQRMDTKAVVDALPGRIGHAHAKDVVFNEGVLGTEGLLDQGWPGASSEVAWSFATVGRGHDQGWWSDFVACLTGTAARAIAIEHEDPDVPAEAGVPAAASVLERARWGIERS
jgi:sugar phosphate isomerase/epimerase